MQLSSRERASGNIANVIQGGSILMDRKTPGSGGFMYMRGLCRHSHMASVMYELQEFYSILWSFRHWLLPEAEFQSRWPMDFDLIWYGNLCSEKINVKIPYSAGNSPHLCVLNVLLLFITLSFLNNSACMPVDHAKSYARAPCTHFSWLGAGPPGISDPTESAERWTSGTAQS